MAEVSEETRLDLGEGKLRTEDGLTLYYRYWRPDSPCGALVLVHGSGEHIGRFDHVARYLAGRGLAVYGYDQRGLGRSEGRQGHLDRFEHYLQDLDRMVTEVRRLSPGLPLGVYGHSMGGLVVLAYGLRHPDRVGWVVATSPWLELVSPPPAWKAALARFLSRVWPAFTMPSGIPASYLAHPPEVGEAYIQDRYVTTKVSARWYTELVKGAAETLAGSPRFTLPLLVLQAGDDRLVSAAATEEFCRKAGSRDKTFRLLPGLYHEIHNEPEAPAVMAEVGDWLERRLAPAGGRG